MQNNWVRLLGGYPGVKTPNIDRLAQRGVLFRNAHCASPLCNPSRTALLTGRRADTTGVYNNDQYWRPVHPDYVTLPMHFKANGYHAAGDGKIFHHVVGSNPPDQWDEFQLQQFDDPWWRRPKWYPWVKKEPNPPGRPFNGIQNFQGEFDWGVLPTAKMRAQAIGMPSASPATSSSANRPSHSSWPSACGILTYRCSLRHALDMYPDPRLPEVPGNDLEDIPETGRSSPPSAATSMSAS